jgi:RNase H-fold protein (predicted Holliday junction resolvase)
MSAADVLGIDPGHAKAGYAVLDSAGAVLEQGVEPIAGLGDRLASVVALHAVRAIALGKGTNAAGIAAAVRQLGLPVHLVDEYETSRHARELYFRENPPRGWRRLIPTGLQLPPRPVDDYAAILIARRFLARCPEQESPK